MTTTHQPIIDPFPIASLAGRYESKDGKPIGKSALNDRLNALGIKSFPQRGQGTKRFIRAADVLRLNALDLHIHENGSMNGFPGLIAASGTPSSVTSTEASTGNSAASTGSIVKSSTAALASADSPSLWQTLTAIPAEEGLTRLIKPLQQLFYPKHRKIEDVLRTLALCTETKGVLATSQISELLDCSPESLSGKKKFVRMGYAFIKIGKEGRESGWIVIKAKLPQIEE